MQSLGFNNLIISNDIFDPDILRCTMDTSAEYGFRRIFFLLNYDPFTEPLSFHVDKKKNIQELINDCKPRGIYSQVYTNLLLDEDTVYQKQIQRAAIRKTQFLFCEFPLFNGRREWIDPSLNYLLYTQKKKPVFVSFEKVIATYDGELVDHLINTRLAAFMIDVNSFANPNAIPYIKKLIEANTVIIPGMSGVMENYANLSSKIEYFKDRVGQPLFSKLLVNSSKSSQLVFGI